MEKYLSILFILISISFLSAQDNLTSKQRLYPIKENQRWGAINQAGEIIIPPQFDFIGNFKEGAAIAQKGNKMGIINQEGQALLSFDYHNLLFLNSDLIAVAKSKWGIVNRKGEKLLPEKYEQIVPLPNYLRPNYIASREFYIFREKDQWGLMDKVGKIISSPNYDSLLKFNDRLILTKKENKIGFLTTEGRLAYTTELDAVKFFQPEQYFLISKDSLKGLMDWTGKKIIATQYDEIHFRQDSLNSFFEVIKDGQKGLYSLDGKEILSAQFQKLEPFVDDLFFVWKKGKMGLYRAPGEEIIPAQYDEIRGLSVRFFLLASKNKKGVFDLENNRISIPLAYTSIRLVFPGAKRPPFFLLAKDKKTIILDSKGQALHPGKGFDRVIYDKRGIFRIQNNQLWGLISQSSFLSPTYHQISRFNRNIALIQKGEAYGLINIYAQVLAPPVYQKIIIKGNTARLYPPQGAIIYLKLDAQGRIVDQLDVKTLKSFRIKKSVPENKPKETEWRFDFAPLPPGEAEVSLSVDRDSLTREDASESGIKQDSLVFDNFRWIKVQNRWGLRDHRDSVWIPHDFTEIQTYPNIGLSLVSYRDITRDRSGNARIAIFRALVNHQSGKMILRPGLHPQIYSMISDFNLGPVAQQRRFYLKKNGERIYKAPYMHPKSTKAEQTLIYFAERFNRSGISRFNVKGYPASFRTRAIRERSDVKGGKWGLMNRDGVMLFPPAYDEIWPFDQEGFARVFLNKRQGIIHKNGQEILAPIYGDIQILKIDGKTYFLISKVDPQVGFVNYQGSVVIPLQFKSARDYRENRAAVEVDSAGWTFTDDKGKVIHPPIFNKVRDFSEGNAAVQTRTGWGYLDSLGRLNIQPRYHSCGDFYQGRAWVLEKGRFGYINAIGQLRVPAIFKDVRDFQKGMGVVRLPGKKKKYGLIDSLGNWIMKPKYAEIRAFGEIAADLALVRKGKKWGFIDALGQEILAPKYEKIYPFQDGKARVATENKFTWINRSGEERYPKFEKVQDFSDGLAAVRRRYEWAFMDTLGNIQIPFRFSDAGKFYKGFAQVRLEGKIVFIDKKGEVYPELSPYIHWINLKYVDRLEAFYDGVAAYQYNGKWGYINQKGRILLSPRYPKLSPFYKGLAQVESKRGTFYIDQYGKSHKSLPNYRVWQDRNQPYYQIFTEKKKYGFNTPLGFNLVSPRYEKLGSFQEGKAKVRLSQFKGLADTEGQILIPAKYESLKWLGNDIFQMEKDGKIMYWNMYKGWIWN